MQNKQKKKTVALCAALIGVLAVGGMAAYFTDTDTKTNTFTVGNVDIVLTEPSFPESGRVENIVPNQVIAKDPTVTLQNGSNSAYAFIEIVVPKHTDGQELFDLIKADGSVGINTGWTLVTETTGTDTNTRVYAYNTELTQSSNETTPLFSSVRFKEGWTDISGEKNIVVNAYAIQKDNLGTEDKGEIWTMLKNSLPENP